MATFDPTVNKTNDPSYLSSSQGTDRASLQQLASVPELSTKTVTPDYKADRSVGTLFEGVGELGKAALTLTDNVIKKNLDDTLNEGLGKIRDSFGVAQAADQSSGIAQAVGKAGAEGVSLTGEAPQQPLAINRLGNKIDGLTEAYQQGGLSNSAYWAKMEAYVRQVKQQYPGYGDEVDSMVSSKLGTTPANAVRSSLLQDVTELQKKVQAGNDKWTTYEHSNTQYIHTQWPNYEELKAQGKAPGRAEVEEVVGRLQARDYSYSSKVAGLNAMKATDEAIATKAEEIIGSKAYDIGSHLSVGVTNTLGIKSPEDFTQLLNDVRNGKRKPLTPDEKTAAAGVLATMEQQYNISFDQFVHNNNGVSGGATIATRLGNPSKLAALRDQGMQSIKDLRAGLLDEKTGVMVQSANYSAARLQAEESSILRRSEAAATVSAGRKLYGDQAVQFLLQSDPQLQSMALEGLRQVNQGQLAKGGSSLSEVFDTYKNEKVNDAKLNRAAIADSVNTIFHADKTEDPKTAMDNATAHLFGPKNRTLIEAFDDKNQVEVFTKLVSPTMTKVMGKADKKNQDQYYNWAEQSFTSIYENQAKSANGVAEQYKDAGSKGVKLVYDPASANFRYDAGSAFQATGLVNGSVQGLNTGINAMKDVWKAQGKDPTTELHRLLPVIGVDPGSPLYNAVQREYLKSQRTTSANP